MELEDRTTDMHQNNKEKTMARRKKKIFFLYTFSFTFVVVVISMPNFPNTIVITPTSLSPLSWVVKNLFRLSFLGICLTLSFSFVLSEFVKTSTSSNPFQVCYLATIV